MSDIEASMKRAQALLDLDRPAEAVPLLTEAVRGAPGNPDAHCLLALSYLDLKEAQQALVHADRAVAIAPSNEWPHRLRSLALCNLGEGNEARKAAAQAIRMQPRSYLAWIAQAQAEAITNRLRSAFASAQRARDLAPNQAEPYLVLGKLALHNGQSGKAEEELRRALALEPENVDALIALADALYRQNRPEEALSLLRTAGLNDPRRHAPVQCTRNIIESHYDTRFKLLVLAACLWLAICEAVVFFVLNLWEIGTGIVVPDTIARWGYYAVAPAVAVCATARMWVLRRRAWQRVQEGMAPQHGE